MAKPVNYYQKWTLDELVKLRRLVAENYTKKKIATKLRRTRLAIETMAKKEGLSFERPHLRR